MNKNRCPVCKSLPEVRVDEGMTTIKCHGHIVVHELHFRKALRRWNKVCKNFRYEEPAPGSIRPKPYWSYKTSGYQPFPPGEY